MSLPSATRAAIDDLIDSRRDALNFPGVALAVTDGDDLLYTETYGFADVGRKQPVEPDTQFEIGSITKSFTAFLIVQAALEGRLDLHAPVQDHIPWFSVRSQHDAPITLHHLLQHSAGIIAGAEGTPEARSEVWALRETPVYAEPGTWYHYSNTGYKALGIVLEECYGQSYAELLWSRVLGPLGMTQTSPVITNATRRALATGYGAFADDERLPPGGELAPATWLVSGCADGCVTSTAADMARYLRAWMTAGPVITDAVIRTATEDTILTDRTAPDVHHGYGWELCTIDGHRHFFYGGGMVGYSTYVVADRDAQLGVVLLTNGPSDPERLAWEVLSIVRADQTGAMLSTMPWSGSVGTDAVSQNPWPDRTEADWNTAVIDTADDAGDPLAGHWRSHNPWFTNFRTARRDGRLLLISPGGVESPGDELELIRVGENTYRLGRDERSPEQLSYAMFIDGRPHEVRLNGCPYHRSFL